ncbi:Stage II sporulation P family protein [Desulforamulus reducens MI-1]|uniref:Stage II sporulation P family protein n=1 Tax=Desulforamulus reducens (strain ATCC BAA-1160 / DSM 100696 / MI-1) TaxID=349161 RepID=A4J3N7_DESRM|nr:stage II sporulation protein P [Desulforamulus reducens]ABO49690.1 Stage II sporulation P family protein [Desulforamulus reducens MI-1]
MKTKLFRTIVSICCILMGVGIIGRLSFAEMVLPAWNPALLLTSEEVDHLVGKSIDILDEKGNRISQACRGVAVGDEIINSEGQHYRITKVSKGAASAKSLGMDKDFLAWNEYFTDERLAMAAAAPKTGTVGVYHTHSDEAYVPTDGSESIPFKGGIYDVGQSFVQRLKAKSGTNVVYDKTPHDPHDNAAYQRSRRTAMNIMKQNPIAIIDVHRDGIPDPSYYTAKVADTEVSKLRLVVGRQNPNMQANLDFARRMMAYSNKVHPKIVKEIFMAKGNYNQDLMPTALLIEAGTHTNTKQQAENGVALFADAVPTVLGIQGGPTTQAKPNVPGGGVTGDGATGAGGWKAVGWILGLTLILGGGFLLISSGSLKGLSGFGKEFTNYLGPLKKIARKKETNKTKDQSKKADGDMADRAVIDHRDDVTED